MLPWNRLSAALFASCLSCLLLAGCKTNAPKPDVPKLPHTDSFTLPVESHEPSGWWWEQALPGRLADQVNAMLRNNTAVQLADIALEKQQALLQKAKADTQIQLDASANNRITREDGDNSHFSQAGLDASLPLDVSGELSERVKTQQFLVAAAQAGRNQARLEKVSDYLQAHIDAAEAYQLTVLLQQQIGSAQTLLQLTEFRFAQGLAESIDVLQQREQLVSIQQQLPAIQLNENLAQHQLAVLAGLAPTRDTPSVTAIPTLTTTLTVSSPLQLLQQHPALQEQQALLAAADADYEAAIRAGLPELNLSSSALLQLSSGDLSGLLRLALSAGMNLVDGGQHHADTQIAATDLQSAGLNYLQTWLDHLAQVEALLQRIQVSTQQLSDSENRLAVSSELFDAAQRRYERGVSDYLPVLSAQRSLNQQQRNHLSLQAQRQRLIVQLQTATAIRPQTEEQP